MSELLYALADTVPVWRAPAVVICVALIFVVVWLIVVGYER